jgi:hypothetical protein
MLANGPVRLLLLATSRHKLAAALLAGLFAWFVIVREKNGGFDETTGLGRYEKRTAGPMEEIGCRGVNTLEKLADAALTHKGNPELFEQTRAAYGEELASFRVHVREIFNERARGPTQATCRSDAIAKKICVEGRKLPTAWRKGSPEGTTWGQYDQLMHSLARDVVEEGKCHNFHLVAPWIFQWCHSGSYDPLLSQDPHHAADHGDLAAAITLGADYGTPAVPLVYHWGHGFVKEERVQHAGHVLVVQRALSTDIVHDINQVVEFGGGTGDMGALIMDMGFTGAYFVYDMAPMNLLQLYWLRYSGHAAFLSSNLQQLPGVKPKGLVMQGAEDEVGFTKLLDRSPVALKRSLFMAYFSLNEADTDARDKILRHTQDFGRILIALHHRADGFYGGGWGGKGIVANQGVEVRGYFQKWVTETLRKTHSVCIWHFKPTATGPDAYPAGSFYLAAIHKDLGTARCLPELNCELSTLHPTIPSDCNPR